VAVGLVNSDWWLEDHRFCCVTGHGFSRAENDEIESDEGF